MDIRIEKIINLLINREDFLSLREISALNNCSRRTVYYDLDKINELLKDCGLEELNIIRNKGIILSKKQKEKILIKLPTIQNNNHFFSPMERVKIIICTVLKRDKKIFVEDFGVLCKVSRNTILNDIKVVQRLVNESDLNFVYSKDKGYYIEGNVVRKRSLFFLYFNDLYRDYRNGLIHLDHLDIIKDYVYRINCIENELGYEFVSSITYSIAVFFSTINERRDLISFSESEVLEISKTKEFELVSKYFSQISSFEQLYMTLHLLGSRLQTAIFKIDNENDNETYDLACDLVEEFSRISNIEFNDRSSLEEAIYVHFKSSLYRFRYGIQIGNPLLNDIKREYKYLFNVTKKAVEYLEQQLALPISDAEIAYLTLHFGGAIKKNKNKNQRILVVCPNGISTSKMLLAEIKAMTSENCIIEVATITNINDDDYDVVISTVGNVKLKNMTKLIVVNPIITDIDRIAIMKRCMVRRENILEKEMLFKQLKNYIKEDKLKIAKSIIYHSSNNDNLKIMDSNLSFYSVVKKGLFLQEEKNVSWEKSIYDVCDLLEKKGYINGFYSQNIIKQLNLYGPYMFVADGVIVAHSKISDGSLKLGLAIGFYPNGVKFERNKIAKLVMVLACQDQSSHLSIISDIITLFSQPENIVLLKKAKTTKDLNSILEKVSINNKDDY